MSDQNPYEKFPDLEIIELRKRVRELEASLAEAKAVLRDNGLEEAKSVVSDEEAVCIRQIAKYKELSDKNVPFQPDDVKMFETLVKTLLAIRGKVIAPVQEKKKKKEEKPELEKLLSIVGDKKFERD